MFFRLVCRPERYWLGESRDNWQTASRSSAELLAAASLHPDAVIRVYGARTVRWKAIFAIHTWIVVKEQMLLHIRAMTTPPGVSQSEPMASAPMRVGLAPYPETIVAVDGAEADRLIPKIRHIISGPDRAGAGGPPTGLLQWTRPIPRAR